MIYPRQQGQNPVRRANANSLFPELHRGATVKEPQPAVDFALLNAWSCRSSLGRTPVRHLLVAKITALGLGCLEGVERFRRLSRHFLLPGEEPFQNDAQPTHSKTIGPALTLSPDRPFAVPAAAPIPVSHFRKATAPRIPHRIPPMTLHLGRSTPRSPAYRIGRGLRGWPAPPRLRRPRICAARWWQEFIGRHNNQLVSTGRGQFNQFIRLPNPGGLHNGLIKTGIQHQRFNAYRNRGSMSEILQFEGLLEAV